MVKEEALGISVIDEALEAGGTKAMNLGLGDRPRGINARNTSNSHSIILAAALSFESRRGSWERLDESGSEGKGIGKIGEARRGKGLEDRRGGGSVGSIGSKDSRVNGCSMCPGCHVCGIGSKDSVVNRCWRRKHDGRKEAEGG